MYVYKPQNPEADSHAHHSICGKVAIFNVTLNSLVLYTYV